MHRLVYQVFKTIMLAIILVFAFDILAYLYRAVSLNQRVESLMTSLKKVVMENNYLPQEQAELYQQLLCRMAADFNAESGQVYDPSNPTQYFQSNDDAFIVDMGWNMLQDATGTVPQISGQRRVWNGTSWSNVTTNVVCKRMGSVADYGDVQTIQLHIQIAMPTWGFFRANGSASDFELNSSFNKKLSGNNRNTTTFTYTYFVPCLKYSSYSQ